jgi:GAF domain-containing protein
LDATGLLLVREVPDLQDIVELAATICRTPYAMVSLIDHDRQVFKARIGLNASETPRDVSFCGHAILSDAPMIIPDAATDERFVGNPLVEGPPHLRFYAGIPLLVGGQHAIGTLCVGDTKPREFDERMLDALNRLTRIARLHIQGYLERARPVNR